MTQKKRITPRNASYEYFHVEEYADGSIILEPRGLTIPSGLSKRTAKMMDQSVDNLKKGTVSPALDLSELEK